MFKPVNIGRKRAGYPTIKFFKNGVASEYTGGRTASEIEGWVRKASGPASTVVHAVEVAQKLIKVCRTVLSWAVALSFLLHHRYFPHPFLIDCSLLQDNEFIVFGAFSDASSVEFQAFLDAAGRGSLPFAHTFDAAVAQALGAAIPSATAHKKFDGGKRLNILLIPSYPIHLSGYLLRILSLTNT